MNEKIRLLSRYNSVKLGTYCNPSDNDWQPWSPILLSQKTIKKKSNFKIFLISSSTYNVKNYTFKF